MPLSDLNEENIFACVSWLQACGLARSTALGRARNLLLAWRWMYRQPDLQRWLSMPPDKLELRAEPPRMITAASWAQADACVEHMPRKDWAWRLATILRFTGLRLQEAILLEWTDLDLDACTMTIRAETTKARRGERRIPISEHFAGELAGWPTRARSRWLLDPPAGVRAGDQLGRHYRATSAHVLRQGWRASEVPEKYWKGQPAKAFRRCFQTELLTAGASWEGVRWLVGHRPEGVASKHYVQLERALWEPMAAAVVLIPPRDARTVLQLQQSPTCAP